LFAVDSFPPSKVLVIASFVFWSLDVILGFFSGYVIGRIFVLEQSKVAKHYLCNGFLLDFGLVAIDCILIVQEYVLDGQQGRSGSVARLGRSVRTLKLLKTLKLLRTVKLKKYIHAVQDMITNEAVSIWFGILKVVVCLLLVNHLVACLWFLVGNHDCQCGEEPGWVSHYNMLQRSIGYRYVTSLHWSLAQFTPAPNEVFPRNFFERTFATFVLLTALVSFSAFTGTVTAGVMQLKRMNSEESRSFWQLRRYLKEWSVPQRFRRRVLSYLEHAYAKQRKRVQEKDVVLLGSVSLHHCCVVSNVC
jgi:hypothetical protein